MRFFFDCTSNDDTILDYRGEGFKGSGSALDYGKTIAEHLRCALNRNWRGWTLAIRDVQGRTVHQLPIDGPELVAA